MFRGVECREPLSIEPSQQNIRYAINRRGEILSKIERQLFNYADEFPRSNNLKRFGMAPSDRTVGDLLDAYEKIAEAAVSPSTWKGYSKVIKRRLRPWFGKTLLRELTLPVIWEKLQTAEVTLKTARNILTPLAIAVQFAVDAGELQDNPVRRVSLRTMWPKDRRKSGWRADPFSWEEMEKIFAACEAWEVDYWRFAFGSGLRPSEQIALELAQCDLATKRVRIEQAQVMGIHGAAVKDPKTDAGRRTLVLTVGAWDALQRVIGNGRSEGRVFLDARHGGAWRDEQALRKRWARILKKAKVRYRNPYQTRHTFASVLLAAGVPDMWVARQMGHANTAMLVRNYGRWIEQGSNTATREALNAFFSHASPTGAEVVNFR